MAPTDLSLPEIVLAATAAAFGVLLLAVTMQLPVVVLLAWWRRRRPGRDDGRPAAPVRRAGGQTVGARETQEDEIGFIDSRALDPRGPHPVAIVADGMGGHAGGEVASRIAVRAFVEAYADEGRVADRLRAALDRANEAIGRAIDTDRALDGMGTTLVAAALTSEGLEWISVGDSRLCLYRDGRLRQLNADHSMAPVIAAMREVDPAAADGMKAHELRSALVGRTIAKIDVSTAPERLKPGDLVLLASDGLDTLDDEETAAIITARRADGPEAVTDALLAAVQAHGREAQDNATVALLEAPDAAPQPRM